MKSKLDETDKTVILLWFNYNKNSNNGFENALCNNSDAQQTAFVDNQ